MFAWTSLVTALTLLVYFVLTINVGRARAKYKVPVPRMSGDVNFERVLRVQQNTLEQLIFFLPNLWLFSYWYHYNACFPCKTGIINKPHANPVIKPNGATE